MATVEPTVGTGGTCQLVLMVVIPGETPSKSIEKTESQMLHVNVWNIYLHKNPKNQLQFCR
jgi:hypothetical protein